MALTDLDSVKAWIPMTNTDNDALLTRLINQISGATLSNLQRPSLVRQSYPEIRDGTGSQVLLLRNWPVVSISSVTINGVTIQPSSSPSQAGYILQTWDGTSAGNPQSLVLRGYTFTRGLSNVGIVYEAGYCVQEQAATIPGSVAYTIAVTPPNGGWSQDDGVTLADGTALVAITSGSPATGQYKVSAPSLGAVTYTFNSAQAGLGVLISYSYTPADLQEAVIEWVVERYRYKDRVGQSSKSLGGNETSSYSLRGIPDFIDIVFHGYRKVIPL